MTGRDTAGSKMAESGQSERSSLGTFVKKQTKYGTTAKPSCINETYLKHYVKPGETLQGIALKYGMTMERIKRANNIWTNDSLFLREYLLIPLAPSPMQEAKPFPLVNGDGGLDSSSMESSGEIVTKQELQRGMSRSSSSRSIKSTDSAPGGSDGAKKEISARDFLSKFDSSLKMIKTSVKKLEETSNFPEDGSNPLNYLPPKKHRHGSRHRRSFEVESDDPSAEPNLIILSKSRSQQLRTSLEQLEKSQDDMFQL